MAILIAVVLVLAGVLIFVLARRRRRRIEAAGGDIGHNVLEIIAVVLFVAGLSSLTFTLHR